MGQSELSRLFGPDGKPGFHLRGYNEQQNGLVKRRTAPADEMVGRESSGARSLEAKNAHEKTEIRADIGFWRFRFFISTLGRDALGAPDNPRLIVEFCGCPQLFLFGSKPKTKSDPSEAPRFVGVPKCFPYCGCPQLSTRPTGLLFEKF